MGAGVIRISQIERESETEIEMEAITIHIPGKIIKMRDTHTPPVVCLYRLKRRLSAINFLHGRDSVSLFGGPHNYLDFRPPIDWELIGWVPKGTSSANLSGCCVSWNTVIKLKSTQDF